MSNAITSPATFLAAVMGARTGQRAKHDAASSTKTVRRGRHVKARDLHPGDVVQQCDWLLHVREVNVSQAAVAIAVAEFDFPLHYAAGTQVSLAA
jgi:hypothetical protein